MRPHDIADFPLPIRKILHVFNFSLTFQCVEQRISSSINLHALEVHLKPRFFKD